MRLNENTVLYGDRVILVPYRAEHVPTYHEWMKSPELLELTASEPLSYDEELDMQRKWHLDEDKLTFILLARPSPLLPTQSSSDSASTSTLKLSPEELRRCKMVGDVNLFLPDGVEGDGECEIMIASKDDRRKGYAIEALSLFLSYLTKNLPLPPTHLIARISSTNKPSIILFQKLGFQITKHVKVFDEVEMRFGGASSVATADVEEGDGDGDGDGDIAPTSEELSLELGLPTVKELSKWSEISVDDRIGVYDA